ncbi:MAG: thioredoxin family protein [Bacteroidales bacterium]|nr:thioredoxin family protein [Bacteroidales bacterium]
MKRIIAIAALFAALTLSMRAQELKKVYDESIDPMEQIDKALAQAKAQDKFVVCQLGGNWCPWCLRFAAFIEADQDISKVIADNYVYIHVNRNPRSEKTPEAKAAAQRLMKRLGNAGRFGYPVFIILDGKGKVVHIQDSALLEKDNTYDKEKVLRFFKNWTPACAAD